MPDQIAVFVGTDKGGFILTSDTARKKWDVTGPHLPGYRIYHMSPDSRDGSIHMAANHDVYGSEIVHSTVAGRAF